MGLDQLLHQLLILCERLSCRDYSDVSGQQIYCIANSYWTYRYRLIID